MTHMLSLSHLWQLHTLLVPLCPSLHTTSVHLLMIGGGSVAGAGTSMLPSTEVNATESVGRKKLIAKDKMTMLWIEKSKRGKEGILREMKQMGVLGRWQSATFLDKNERWSLKGSWDRKVKSGTTVHIFFCVRLYLPFHNLLVSLPDIKDQRIVISSLLYLNLLLNPYATCLTYKHTLFNIKHAVLYYIIHISLWDVSSVKKPIRNLMDTILAAKLSVTYRDFRCVICLSCFVCLLVWVSKLVCY